MNIGFIGAGKVGCTMGLHLINNNKMCKVTGYYDISKESLQETLDITSTKEYTDLKSVIEENEMIFITTTDSVIGDVFNQIKKYNIKEKIICHCSGSLSSAIFSDIDIEGAYGYSIHPLFACSSKTESYKKLPDSLFTIEGNEEKIDFIKTFLESMGNKVQIIDKDVKSKYHAAAVVASNQMLALAQVAIEMLIDCGFSKENASKALNPLIENNINSLISNGVTNSLTGPIERNDIGTIKKHMNVLSDKEKEIYTALSKVLIDIAKEKNINNDYSELKEYLIK